MIKLRIQGNKEEVDSFIFMLMRYLETVGLARLSNESKDYKNRGSGSIVRRYIDVEEIWFEEDQSV